MEVEIYKETEGTVGVEVLVNRIHINVLAQRVFLNTCQRLLPIIQR